MKTRTLLIWICLLAGGGSLYADETLPFNPERLWLPPSAASLRPALEEAARRASRDPECAEVLYGRLNNWRTEQGDPSMTILCQRDARSTFDLVYRVAELSVHEEEEIPDFSSRDAESNLETLRRLLMSESESGVTAEPETEASDPERQSTTDEADRSLELDLDELLRNRNQNDQQEAPPELF